MSTHKTKLQQNKNQTDTSNYAIMPKSEKPASYLSKKINSAMDFAKQIHEGHKRASGENYFEHTFRVYQKLVDSGVTDETTLIAAILHQALDFSNEVADEIEKKFGSDVAKIVRNYRKLSQTTIETNTPKNFNEKYIMQTYINMVDDIRALVVRIVDKIDNLNTSFALPKEKRIYSAQRAVYLYAPLARMIGLGKFALEIENTAFKIINPREYKAVEKTLSKKLANVHSILNDTQKILYEVLEENGIKAKISYRTKHIYGVYRKANYYKSLGRNPGKNFENIHDIVAMRIVVDTVEQCYVVENILKELMDYIPDLRDDFIRNPRKNGYKSLHNIFKLNRTLNAEIQIRTVEMHELSEHGPASHLLYKIGDKDAHSKASESFKKYSYEKPYWFKDVNFWEMEKALAEYKPNTPFSKYVYAFTPKGDIIELPRGANLIDFAYAVHTKLGHSCIGGFVNGQLVKLTYEINDGDIVEIKTLKSKTKPSPDWIKIVKTSRAKGHIRRALKINE